MATPLDCGMRPTCKWKAEVWNAGRPDEHVVITCYSPDGPAEVCTMNPDMPTEEALRIGRRIARSMNAA